MTDIFVRHLSNLVFSWLSPTKTGKQAGPQNSGGGDRTRTCMTLRSAVFKTPQGPWTNLYHYAFTNINQGVQASKCTRSGQVHRTNFTPTFL